MQGPLGELTKWYADQCDGDWEHQYGIDIGTLDNPGFEVKIDLVGTRLQYAPFTPIEWGSADGDWHHCRIESNPPVWKAACSPGQLEEVLGIFNQWARRH